MPRKKNPAGKSERRKRKARGMSNAYRAKEGSAVTNEKGPEDVAESLNDTTGFITAADKIMPADQVVQMFSDSISHATGNTEKIDVAKTLQPYGFDTQRQVDTFSGFVIGSADYGVKHYGFSLKADSLSWVTNTTKLGDLLDFVQDNAVSS